MSRRAGSSSLDSSAPQVGGCPLGPGGDSVGSFMIYSTFERITAHVTYTSRSTRAQPRTGRLSPKERRLSSGKRQVEFGRAWSRGKRHRLRPFKATLNLALHVVRTTRACTRYTVRSVCRQTRSARSPRALNRATGPAGGRLDSLPLEMSSPRPGLAGPFDWTSATGTR